MRLLAATAAVSMLAVSAQAQTPSVPAPRTLPSAGSFAVVPQLGTDFTVGGVATKAVSQSIAAAGTVTSGGTTITFNAAGTLSYAQKRFDDVYERPIVFGVGGAYGLSQAGEVFGSFRFVHASGKSSTGGTLTAAGTINGTAFTAGATSTVKPDDFTSYGIDAGYRHFFPQPGGFTPYIGALVGLQRTEAIKITESLAGVSSKVRLYDASFVPSAGLQLGFTYSFAPSAAVGLETGIRYDYKLKGNDSDLSSAFRSINDAGDRWSIPVLLTGRIAF